MQTLRYVRKGADLFSDSLVGSTEDVEWRAVGGGLVVVFGHDDLEGGWDDGFEHHVGGGVGGGVEIGWLWMLVRIAAGVWSGSRIRT